MVIKITDSKRKHHTVRPSEFEQVEESYRTYYKTAFEASAIHPAEVIEEVERIRAVVCARVGLKPTPEEAVPSAGCEAAAEGISDAGSEGRNHGEQNVRHWKNMRIFVCMYVCYLGWEQSKSCLLVVRISTGTKQVSPPLPSPPFNSFTASLMRYYGA